MSEKTANNNALKKRNNTKIYLIVASIIFGILILPSLPMIIMSPMMFDSPGSENSIPTITLVISLVAYPFVTVFSIAVSWIAFVKRRHLFAIIAASLPILNILIGIAAIVYMAVVCDGNLDC